MSADALLRAATLAVVLLVVGSILYEVLRSNLPFEVRAKYPKHLPAIGARKGDWFPRLQAKWRSSQDIRKATEDSWFQSRPESDLSAQIHQLNAFQLNFALTDPPLVEETQPIHQTDVWSTDTDYFKELCLMDDMPDVVEQVVNRAFVGAPDCHNNALVHRRILELYVDQAGKAENSRKYNDFLQWTIDAAVQSGSSSLDDIEKLQAEIVASLEKHGGGWNKRTPEDMPKFGSMFRESQRRNSIVTVASPKPVCNPDGVTTPSGLHIPYGAYIGILSYPILHDPALYPEPETFRPFRFAGRREEADRQGLKMEKAH
ncbi:hypothetical protein DL766_003213 [Monosporascus sp. MC13-8B]|uniref:Uncharacterized protein n=1 Tax=Monosporascus cannonballus TaxID=155416 RepID=A0ABY0H4C1_9PEZI|nr:hypothetical protein DL762_006720 [Monosporascus cannonballus]RYO92522.1 hypothetical protein DL763_004651 [Monosporascus cannonballus]RYP33941.1 hypothetical protein DL766_003213 [Monosporascus sp. MC13-8B]